MSLFLVGIILLVFAAFFHLYRYALSEEKKAPPPPPIPVQEDQPKLPESDVSSETSKLPKDTEPEGKQEQKELAPEVPIPKTQADLGIDKDNNPNLGSDDLEGLKK